PYFVRDEARLTPTADAPYSAYGWSSADLAAGELKVFGQGSGQPAFVSAAASLGDTLFFRGPRDNSGHYDVTVTITASGPLGGGGGHMDLGLTDEDPSSGRLGQALSQRQELREGTTVLSLPLASSGALVLAADIDLPVVTGGTTDFSHTALVSVRLPAGVSFTSESGVFLRVPE